MTRRRECAVLPVPVLLALLLAGSTATAQRPTTNPMLEDALLRDVFFLDAARGWAVGDRGVIWHSADGGRNWRIQSSGVEAPLWSVCFVDEKTGWVAGGFTEPITHTSRGVLLSTRDGGRTWRQEPGLTLPALRRVKFFGPAQGWAWGESSPLHHSGVFFSSNGGRTWTPVAVADAAGADAGQLQRGWLTGDFLDPATGALAGRQGLVAAVRNRSVQPSRSPRFGIRGLRDMQLSTNGAGWLIGDGGLVLTTTDAGLTWQTPRGALPGRTRELFDFHAVAMQGAKCWIAGAPGTLVLHSPDGGATWRAAPTGQSVPIHGLHFADGQSGWAVGALGTILATTDGGQTWRMQRGGGTRAALLGIFAHPDDVPLELVAQLSGNEGYLGVADVLCRRDIDQGPLDRQTEAERTHEALLAVGGSAASTAWQFPVRQPGVLARGEQVLDGWNRANDGRGLARLQEYLVREIRCWRPEIIVTHAASPQGGDPLGHTLNQLVLQAVEAAADASQFSHLASDAALAPWQVKKVFGALPRGNFGDVSLNAGQLAPNLGRSPAEAALHARTLLLDQMTDGPATLGFRLSVNRIPQEIGRRGFFSGITLHPGGDARRAISEVPNDLEMLRRSAEKHRNVRAIIERAQETAAGAAPLIGQLSDMTKGLTTDATGQLLFELAQRCQRSGQGELAAETFELLLRRHPQHPLATPAAVWLVQYWSSSEVAWRLQAARRVTVQPVSAAIDPRRPFDASAAPAGDVRTPPVEGIVSAGTGRDDRPARAAEIGKLIERTFPALYAEPRVRFPLAVAQVNRGYPREAERFYLAQRRGAPDAWQRCAAGEGWLQGRQGPPPVPVATCARAAAKPYLDGKLDDGVWRSAKPLELRSHVDANKAWRAAVKLAFDDEHLYLGAVCQGAAVAATEARGETRPRDADLSRHDRAEFLLDLDRDYATYYHFAVDERGWTWEACWGDKSWNPQWFVASARDARSWTIEAAIPLKELTGATPGPATAWAIGLQRVIPGVGFQSWTLPASTAIQPEGFGYLLFE
jgi:photosystem II stability/assembly factor-like uncharacterized protein